MSKEARSGIAPALVMVLLAGSGLPGAEAGGRPTADPAFPARLLGGEVFTYQFDGRDLDTVAPGSVLDRSPWGAVAHRYGNTYIAAGPNGFGGALYNGQWNHLGMAVGNAGGADSLSRDFTLAMWLTIGSGQPVIYASKTADGSYLMALRNDPGGWLHLSFRDGLGTARTYTLGQGLGGWHHYAVAKEGTDLRFYVDGALASSQFAAGTLYRGSPVESDFFGQTPFGEPYTGAFDEARLYDRGLSAAEVRSVKDFPYLVPNAPPVARIAPLPAAECAGGRGDLRLDGTPSSDDDGDRLAYAWTAPGVALDDPASSTPAGSFPLGATEVRLEVSDGQYADRATATARVLDTIPPVTTASLSGTMGNAGWWRSAVQATLTTTDSCGVLRTRSSVDGAPASDGTVTTVAGDRRDHGLAFWGEDIGGNRETPPNQRQISIDATPPTIAITDPEPGDAYVNDVHLGLPRPLPLTLVAGPKTVRAAAADATSEVERVEFWVDGVLRGTDLEAPYRFSWAAGDEALGLHHLELRAHDVAGNQAAARLDVHTVPTTPAGVEATLEAHQVPVPPPAVPGPPEVPDPAGVLPICVGLGSHQLCAPAG